MRTFILGALATLAVATGLTSCGDSSYENHTFYYFRNTPSVYISDIVAYADQTADSCFVATTDTWTLNKSYNEEWLSVSYKGQTPPFTQKIAAGNWQVLYSNRIDLKLQPNTTGKTRHTNIMVTSEFGKIGTTPLYILQYPLLNIDYPALEKDSNDKVVDNGTFTLKNISADGYVVGSKNVKPYVSFTVYSTNATLTSSESWLKVPEPGNLVGTPAYTPCKVQNVELTLEKNTTGSVRTAQLTLTSNGVSNKIKVIQNAN